MKFFILFTSILIFHYVTDGDANITSHVTESTTLANHTITEKSQKQSISIESSLSNSIYNKSEALTTRDPNSNSNVSSVDASQITNSKKIDNLDGENSKVNVLRASDHVAENGPKLFKANQNLIIKNVTKQVVIQGQTEKSTGLEDSSNGGTIAIVIIVIIIILIICAFIYYKKYYQTRYTFIHNFLR